MTDIQDQSAPAAELDFTLKKKKKKSTTAPTATSEESNEVSDLMADLALKKKKKSSKSSKSAEEAGEIVDSDDFDFKKKKKKKKTATASAAADFDAQLEEAGVNEESSKSNAEGTASAASTDASLGVNDRGERDLSYNELLGRFFQILRDNNPDLASDRSGVKYKIPPPSMIRDGKKSIFANIKEISDRMHRPTEHVIQFLFAELGTSGSVDGSQRLVIKGRYMQKQLETVLRKYITEYVSCKTCKSINTKLSKENRIYFLECNSCGSRRSVASIKTGYQAIIRRPR